jgi:hypothetical protein
MTDPERAPLTVVHSSGRAGGKTYQAVAWVLEQDDRVLVVLNGSHRQAVIESWPAMRGRVFTYHETARAAVEGTSLALDNLDEFLSWWLGPSGRDIGLITWTTADPTLIGKASDGRLIAVNDVIVPPIP